MQRGLDDPQYGSRANPCCEQRAADLLAVWRRLGLPVYFTRHLSERLGSPLAEHDERSGIKAEVQPLGEEPVFLKRTNSAFKSPEFARAIAALAPTELVFVGMATDVCITASSREAKDMGYSVMVISDACATFSRTSPTGFRYPAEVVHEVSLAALAVSGIKVCTAKELLQQLRDMAPYPSIERMCPGKQDLAAEISNANSSA